MSQDVITIIQTTLSQFWRFYTGFHVPGTNITPAHILFFTLFAPWIKTAIVELLNMTLSVTKTDNIKSGS